MKNSKLYAKAFAPATVSNVGPGFDIFGFPLIGPGDKVEARMRYEKGVSIAAIHGNSELPLDPLKNTAGRAALALLHGVHAAFGVELVLHKGLPVGSGLGSSAAGAAAAVAAVNHLFENPLQKKALLPYALEGESITSGGVKHGDNVFPSLLGGFLIIRGVEPPVFTRVQCPQDIFCAVLHPHIQISTQHARSILPREVPLSDGVRQAANAATFVAGLLTNDDALIAESLRDFFAEPHRKKLIPHYDAITSAARTAGAIGAGISGSGPSIFALCRGEQSAEAVSAAMRAACEANGMPCDIMFSRVNTEGAVIEEEA